MQPASIPVERKGRLAKTDRIDLDMLLRTLEQKKRSALLTIAPIRDRS
jgi:transposase